MSHGICIFEFILITMTRNIKNITCSSYKVGCSMRLYLQITYSALILTILITSANTQTEENVGESKFIYHPEWKTPVEINSIEKHKASLIFLHGIGDTGHGWADALSKIVPPCMKVVCPTAHSVPVKIGHKNTTITSWFHRDKDNDTNIEDPEDMKRALIHIHRLIQKEVDAGIKPRKVFVGGFSQGGVVAIQSAITFSMKLGGLVALSTWLPMPENFLRTCHKANMNIFILQGHGDKDNVVNYDAGNITYSILRLISNNVDFKTYHGVAHSVSREGFLDMKEFFAKHV